MPFDPNEAAKKALIAYRQLEAITKQRGYASARANVGNYNVILHTLNECFSLDGAFKTSISHLGNLTVEEGRDFTSELEADAALLLATTHAFIELYLSPEEKKKAIGFS